MYPEDDAVPEEEVPEESLLHLRVLGQDSRFAPKVKLKAVEGWLLLA